eukprot:253989_1
MNILQHCTAEYHKDGSIIKNNDKCWICGRYNHFSWDCVARTTVDHQPITDPNALPYKPKPPQLSIRSDENKAKKQDLYTYKIIRVPIHNSNNNANSNNNNNQLHSEMVEVNNQDPQSEQIKRFFGL